MTTYLYNIPSGEIVAGSVYQVYGTTDDTITYNGTTYSPGDFFTGVDGVTDYTISGSPIVTYSSEYKAADIGYYEPFLGKFNDDSEFKGQSISIQDDFFLGKFNDESHFLGISISWEEKSNYKNRVSLIRTFPNNMTEKQRITEQNL